MLSDQLRKWMGWSILLLGLMFFYKFFFISQIAKLPFGSYHAWRQADCISVTDHLYKGKSTLCKPQTHFTKSDGTHLAAGEFPLINQLVATGYHITGRSYSTYRYFIFAFYLVAVLFIFLILVEFSRDEMMSALFTLMLACGTILVFYGINFLPDVPALAFALAGFYWLNKSEKNRRYSSLILGLFLSCLGILLKISSGTLLFGFGTWILVSGIMSGFDKWRWKMLLGVGLCLLPPILWYAYASRLDHVHSPFIFLSELRPYWNVYPLERPLVWQALKEKWLPLMYIPLVGYFLVGGSIAAIIFSRSENRKTAVLVSGTFLSSVVFFFLLYRQFLHHDYLLICLTSVPLCMGILIVQRISGINNGLLRFSFHLLVCIFLVMQAFQTRWVLKERYFGQMQWLVYNLDLLGLHNELRSHGIGPEDLVISIPDPSPNITLVAMDQPGFTNYREKNKDTKGIEESLELGARYLVVSDTTVLHKDYLQPYTKTPLFQYRGIHVFDLRK